MYSLTNEFNDLKISVVSKILRISKDCPGVEINNSLIKNENVDTKSCGEETLKSTSCPQNYYVQKQILEDLYLGNKKACKQAISDRCNKYKRYIAERENVNRNSWYQKQLDMVKRIEEKESEILQALKQNNEDSSHQNDEIFKHYLNLAEERKQAERDNENAKKVKQELNSIIDSLKENQVTFRKLYQDISAALVNVNDVELKKLLTSVPLKIKKLSSAMENVIRKCAKGTINEDQLKYSNYVIEEMHTLKGFVLNTINNYNVELQKSIEKRISDENVNKDNVKSPEIEKNAEKLTTITSVQNCSSKSSLLLYSELLNYIKKWEKEISDLEQEVNCKDFRFQCKKAVNIPVNAVSNVSKEHLTDKYEKLLNLLSRNKVKLGNDYFTASVHQKGVSFCMNLLAKKIVLQGDLLISSNPEAVFCYSVIIIELWQTFPQFGKLLLAYFCQQCPYLVPFYIPKTKDESDEDYYKKLGYQFTDGTIEKQDKFLKRMSGIMRLYFAILITLPKSGKSPHGLCYAWRWLACVLNLEPRLDITATMLSVFFETVGSTIQKVYGHQFKKIMNTIIKQYLPLIQSKDTGGPISRLECLIREYEKSGRFEDPPGIEDINLLK